MGWNGTRNQITKYRHWDMKTTNDDRRTDNI
jgi:hypothetical protein